jgi:hypothetical protein
MLLTGEVKDKSYEEPPRQQEALYAHSADQYLRADASTGKHYYDLNAANKSYAGPWLFGKEHVETMYEGRKAQWMQWCPVPADLRDSIFVRGNVIYENPDGTSRVSTDLFEGVLRTEDRRRFFIGRTQHTFVGSNLPNGAIKVVANLNICLNQRLPYNPLMVPPARDGETNALNTPSPNYGQEPGYRGQSYSQQPPVYSQQPNYYQEPGYSQQTGYSGAEPIYNQRATAPQQSTYPQQTTTPQQSTYAQQSTYPQSRTAPQPTTGGYYDNNSFGQRSFPQAGGTEQPSPNGSTLQYPNNEIRY